MTDVNPDEVDVDVRAGRLTLIIASTLAVLVALLVLLLATRANGGERSERSPLIGRPAPAIEGPTLDGTVFDMTAYRGRWVVVNFFWTQCVPCIEEHPELVAFQAQHATIGDAALVSVLFDDTIEDATEFFDTNGGGWPVVIDADGGVGVAYGVARVPESFLVTPTGIVVARLVEGVTATQLNEIIDQLESAAA